MSNFDFMAREWPSIHADCRRAESYLGSDPRAACFYSRRAIEVLVVHLYDVLALPSPYEKDLAALTNDAAFRTVTGVGITQKLNLIRKLGNTAVHETRPIPVPAARDALRELHHVMIWAAFRYSTEPDAVPTATQFDPALAAKAAPLSRDDVQKLAARFAAQDEAHVKALAEKDELLASYEQQMAQLRAEIKVAQASKTTVDHHDLREAETRDAYIDKLLREVGWTLGDKRDTEYKVTGLPTETGIGYVDYVLWGNDGLPLAVVEAKRAGKSAELGQQQAKFYADSLETQFGRRPIIFYTNGYEHAVWDDAAGYPPREIAGFFSADELELMIQRRETRQPLINAAVNTDIAGRPYQVSAIKAVSGAFDGKQREALLVMATGSGKTRTVIALVDQLMKANWVKRVLFLADRTALVSQAARNFTEQLPSVSTVDLVAKRKGDGRVYVSTHQTMLNLINQVDGPGRTFSPGFFDLIVIDEAHRSVYAKYGAIFDHFDALLVGLTATPKDEVDHNTYGLFNLEDGVPTDAYSLDEAVDAGYLVPPKGISVGTKFLRGGIKYDDLSSNEKDQWDIAEWGEDGPPAEVGAEEINRYLFNEDTVDKVLAGLMTDGHKVAGGDRLGKTIIFAKSKDHAEFIQKRFDAGWPQYGGSFATTITHGVAAPDTLIANFSQPNTAPHIAISVDMLDTGIDVPPVVNLVFFKVVRSKSKFWQMIGRGTRLCPDLYGPGQHKSDFYVFDYCGNLEFFSQDLPGAEGSTQKSLTQRIVETRIGLLTTLDVQKSDAEVRTAIAKVLHEFVAGMSLDNVIVRPHRRTIERFAEAGAWHDLSAGDAEEVHKLAGVPSTVRDSDEDAKRFDLIMLRRQLAQLEGDTVLAERLQETVQQIAVALLSKTSIPVVAAQAVLLEEMAGDEWWQDVTLPLLEIARLRVRSLVRLIERTRRNPVYTDFADTLGEATEIHLPGVSTGVNQQRFRAKTRDYLRGTSTTSRCNDCGATSNSPTPTSTCCKAYWSTQEGNLQISRRQRRRPADSGCSCGRSSGWTAPQ